MVSSSECRSDSCTVLTSTPFPTDTTRRGQRGDRSDHPRRKGPGEEVVQDGALLLLEGRLAEDVEEGGSNVAGENGKPAPACCFSHCDAGGAACLGQKARIRTAARKQETTSPRYQKGCMWVRRPVTSATPPVRNSPQTASTNIGR